jgi:tetratricopeptide (TPR) repeat protein
MKNQKELLKKAFFAHNNGDFETARICYKALLKKDPKNIEAQGWLGTLEAQSGNLEIAKKYLSFVTTINNNELFSLNYANLLQQMGFPKEAIQIYTKLLNNGFTNKELILQNLIGCFNNLEQYIEAYNLSNMIMDKNNIHYWNNRGNSLFGLKKYQESIDCYNHALNLNPNYPEALANKGNVLYELKKINEALDCYNQALNLNPNYPEALTNKGNVLYELKKINEALDCYSQALNINPNFADALWSKGIILLQFGDYKEGFKLYENRKKINNLFSSLGFTLKNNKEWNGNDSLKEKIILVYAEQGYGDTIQFSRFISKLLEIGAIVYLQIPDELINLFACFKNIKIISTNKIYSDYHYQCSLISLPYLLGISKEQISGKPYIDISRNKINEWKYKLNLNKKLRIGITWSSNSKFKKDYLRSLKLIEFIKCLPENKEKFDIVCLQKYVSEKEKNILGKNQIYYMGEEFLDFHDTAAVIKNLDLVITTCTSVAHLACSLGVKTYILLSYVPDWRWGFEGTQSVWYQSAILYRQSRQGHWDDVLEKIKIRLLDKTNFD